MHIFSNTVVTLSYRLFTAEGELIESSRDPVAYLHGGYDGIFPKVESALAQKQVGDKVSVTLEPEEAFGEYDEELLRVETAEVFPGDVKIGDRFEGVAPGADPSESVIYTITDVAEGKVVADGNHPLAGQRLRFDCTVMEVRPATPEEIQHGHVHGAGGHHHG